MKQWTWEVTVRVPGNSEFQKTTITVRADRFDMAESKTHKVATDIWPTGDVTINASLRSVVEI